MNTYLIVGLGNPGDKYSKTRHNIGFKAIRLLFEEGDYDILKESSKFDSIIAEKNIDDTKIILSQPLTFMNNSGQAVQKIKSYYRIANQNILVIYDDIDLPIGNIRIRKKGGSGTHNGMKSVIQQLGTEDFARIRVGIGEPYPPQKDLSTYVLEPFTKNELSTIEQSLKNIPKIVHDFRKNGIEKAMTNWN